MKSVSMVIGTAILGVISANSLVSAEMVVTGVLSSDQFQASSTDLVNQGQATLAGSAYSWPLLTEVPLPEGQTPLGLANDGQTGYPFFYHPGDGIVISFTLNTELNPYGYNITSLETFAGAPWGGTSSNQHYQIHYTKVGSDELFLLGNISYLEATTTGINSKVTAADSEGGYLMENVSRIEFRFWSIAGTPTAWHEFDVHGVAAPIPEPATAALTLLGAGMLMIRRK